MSEIRSESTKIFNPGVKISHDVKTEIEEQSLSFFLVGNSPTPANINIVKEMAGRLQLEVLKNHSAIDHATFISYVAELQSIGLGPEQAAKLLGNIILMACHTGVRSPRAFLAKNRLFAESNFIKTHILQTETITNFIRDMQQLVDNKNSSAKPEPENGAASDNLNKLPPLIQALIHVYVAQVYASEKQIGQYEPIDQAWAAIKPLINNDMSKISMDMLYVIMNCISIKPDLSDDKKVIYNFDGTIKEYTDDFIREHFRISNFVNTEIKIDPDAKPGQRNAGLSQLTDIGQKFYAYFTPETDIVKRRAEFKPAESATLKPNQFEAMFKVIMGVSYIEFSAMIRGDINFNVENSDTYKQQTIISSKEKYEPTRELRDNRSCKWYQVSLHDDKKTFKCTTDIKGNKTISSNAQQNSDSIFANANQAGHFGINHNTIDLKIELETSHIENNTFTIYELKSPEELTSEPQASYKLKKTDYANKVENKSIEYKLDTVGSYQKDEIGENDEGNLAVINAENLLNSIFIHQANKGNTAPISEEQETFIIDFKPLKGIAEIGPRSIRHDTDVYKQHARIMTTAVENINKNNTENQIKEQFDYVPVWGNSYKIGTPGYNAPESNKKFQKIISVFDKNIDKSDKASMLLLHKLKSITETLSDDDWQFMDDFLSSDIADKDIEDKIDKNNFKSRGKFIMIVAITRILAAKFPGKFVILIGCKEAKDRAMSLLNATNLIIKLFHLKGNLNFITDKARLKPECFKSAKDRDFLKDHLYDKIMHNILSYMGIRNFNNKNPDVFAQLLEDDPELYKLFDQRPLIITSA